MAESGVGLLDRARRLYMARRDAEQTWRNAEYEEAARAFVRKTFDIEPDWVDGRHLGIQGVSFELECDGAEPETDYLRLLGTCPGCGTLCGGSICITNLETLGQALVEPWKPRWSHVERCPSHGKAPGRSFAERLVALLDERYGQKANDDVQ